MIVQSRMGAQVGKLVFVREDWADRRQHEGLRWNSCKGQPAWLVDSLGSPLVYCRSERGGPDRVIPSGPILDAWLRPIRPGDTSDSTEAMKEREAA